jgi:hypothetical protein
LIEAQLCHERWRRWAALEQTGADPMRRRQSTARAIAPHHPQVAIFARLEIELEQSQPFVRQVKKRRLLVQQGPSGAIATSLDPDALEKRCRNAINPDPVDLYDLAQVYFETAARLGSAQRQNFAVFPLPLRPGLIEQQVGDLLTSHRNKPKIPEAILRSGQQIHVDLEPVAAGSARSNFPLNRWLVFAAESCTGNQ